MSEELDSNLHCHYYDCLITREVAKKLASQTQTQDADFKLDDSSLSFYSKCQSMSIFPVAGSAIALKAATERSMELKFSQPGLKTSHQCLSVLFEQYNYQESATTAVTDFWVAGLVILTNLPQSGAMKVAWVSIRIVGGKNEPWFDPVPY